MVQVYDDIFCFTMSRPLRVLTWSTKKHKHLQWMIQILAGWTATWRHWFLFSIETQIPNFNWQRV